MTGQDGEVRGFGDWRRTARSTLVSVRRTARSLLVSVRRSGRSTLVSVRRSGRSLLVSARRTGRTVQKAARKPLRVPAVRRVVRRPWQTIRKVVRAPMRVRVVRRTVRDPKKAMRRAVRLPMRVRMVARAVHHPRKAMHEAAWWALLLPLRVPAVREAVRDDALPRVTNLVVNLAVEVAGSGPDSPANYDPLAKAARALTFRRAGRELGRIADRVDEPVIVGPWVSEVGFEVLYWIPFLHWAVDGEHQLRDRLIVVSRGGTRHWYQHLSTRYVDIFDHLSLKEFTDGMQQTLSDSGGKLKQLEVSEFDQSLVERVRASLQLGDVPVLHPYMMYRTFRDMARQDAAHRMRKVMTPRLFEPPELGSLAGVLPDDYVAVRFYFSACFPDIPENRALVRNILQSLTRHSDVVLLNPGLQVDDHYDFEDIDVGRVHRIDHLMVPSNNLEIQTIAISRARAFIGTYGGLSYLPPFFKVPSLCFYSDPEFFHAHHLEVAQRIFSGPEWGDFVALDARHTGLIGLVSDVMQRERPLAGVE